MTAIQVASCGSILNLFDATTYQKQDSYVPFNGNVPISSMSMSVGANSYFVAVSETGLSEVAGLTSNGIKTIETLKKDNTFDNITAAVFCHTSKQFIGLGSPQGSLGVYDLKLKALTSLFCQLPPVVALEFNANDQYIAAGCENGEVLILSRQKHLKSAVLMIDQEKPSFSSLRFHPVAKNLLTACDHYGSVAVWDINTKKPKLVLRSMHKAPCTDIAFSPINTSLVISVSYDKTFNCYDLNSRKKIISQKLDQAICSLDIHPNGKCMALGSKQGLIYVIDLRNTEKVLQVIEADKTEIHSLMYKPEPKTTNSTYKSFKMDSAFHSSPIANGTDTPISNGSQTSISSTNSSFLEAIGSAEPACVNDSVEDSFLNFDMSLKSQLCDDSVSETSREKLIETSVPSTETLENSSYKQIQNPSKMDLGEMKEMFEKFEKSANNKSEMFKNEILKMFIEMKDYFDKKMAEQFENMRMFDINLKMTMYKQFINQDYRNLSLQKELLEEIHMLRQENADLRNQLNQMFENCD